MSPGYAAAGRRPCGCPETRAPAASVSLARLEDLVRLSARWLVIRRGRGAVATDAARMAATGGTMPSTPGAGADRRRSSGAVARAGPS